MDGRLQTVTEHGQIQFLLRWRYTLACMHECTEERKISRACSGKASQLPSSIASFKQQTMNGTSKAQKQECGCADKNGTHAHTHNGQANKSSYVTLNDTVLKTTPPNCARNIGKLCEDWTQWKQNQMTRDIRLQQTRARMCINHKENCSNSKRSYPNRFVNKHTLIRSLNKLHTNKPIICFCQFWVHWKRKLVNKNVH